MITKLLSLCNFERIQRIRQWPSVRKPPVPIPNTVVKTHNGENTQGATPWEDSSLLASKLNKARIEWIFSSRFFVVFSMQFSLGNHPLSGKRDIQSPFPSAESSRSLILLYTSQSFTSFCYRKNFVHFAPCFFELGASHRHSTQNPQHGRKDLQM